MINKMILQLPSIIKQNCLPYDPTIKLYAWIIAIVYIGAIGIMFFFKMLKVSKEIKSQKEMFRSIGFFLYCYIGVRIFFLFSDLERNINCESLVYFQLVFLGYICSTLAFLNIVHFGEKYILTKTKMKITYIVSVCLIIDALIVIFLPNIVAFGKSQYGLTLLEIAIIIRYFNYAVQYGTGSTLLLLYIYLAIKSTGKLRINALITLTGLVIATIASLLETDALLSSGNIPPYLSPIIFCIGITIFAFAYLRTIK